MKRTGLLLLLLYFSPVTIHRRFILTDAPHMRLRQPTGACLGANAGAERVGPSHTSPRPNHPVTTNAPPADVACQLPGIISMSYNLVYGSMRVYLGIGRVI